MNADLHERRVPTVISVELAALVFKLIIDLYDRYVHDDKTI